MKERQVHRNFYKRTTMKYLHHSESFMYVTSHRVFYTCMSHISTDASLSIVNRTALVNSAKEFFSPPPVENPIVRFIPSARHAVEPCRL
uniref:Uncharacterized protein n=1 Tax=Rhipicephalus zambeziensis TaxID=60191 RepID=A0A224YFT4_9ACAR